MWSEPIAVRRMHAERVTLLHPARSSSQKSATREQPCEQLLGSSSWFAGFRGALYDFLVLAPLFI